MKFEICSWIRGGRAIVKGELKDLTLDKEIVCTYAGDEFVGTVETCYGGGAVVRIHQDQLRQ